MFTYRIDANIERRSDDGLIDVTVGDITERVELPEVGETVQRLLERELRSEMTRD